MLHECVNLADSDEDDASRPAKRARASTEHEPAPDAQTEAACCAICLDVYAASGPHRVVTLKCGHLFGDHCIREALRRNAKCPQCNKRATPKHITVIYNLPAVVASVDTQTVEELQRQLAQVKDQLASAQQQLAASTTARAPTHGTSAAAHGTAGPPAAEPAGAARAAPAVQFAPPRAVGHAAAGPAVPQSASGAHGSGAGALSAPRRAGMVLVPLQPPAAASDDATGVSFSLLQQFSVRGARSFHLDGKQALLWVGESVTQPLGGACVRKISVLCPNAPMHTPLPGAGAVRDVVGQPPGQGAGYIAAATTTGGLQLLSATSANAVGRIDPPTRGLSVWSCRWSVSDPQQLLLGMDKGRVALADVRMSGARALVVVGAAFPQPVHALVHLPPGSCMAHAPAGAEWLLASLSAVYAWSPRAPDAFTPVLAWPSNSCESLAWEPHRGLLAVSWRSGNTAGGLEACHHLFQLTPAAQQADEEARGAQAAQAHGAGRRCSLGGHTSTYSMTSGAFIDVGAAGDCLFASADEAACTPATWSVRSRARVWQPWERFDSSVLKVAGGGTAGGAMPTLMAACSSSCLRLYTC